METSPYQLLFIPLLVMFYSLLRQCNICVFGQDVFWKVFDFCANFCNYSKSVHFLLVKKSPPKRGKWSQSSHVHEVLFPPFYHIFVGVSLLPVGGTVEHIVLSMLKKKKKAFAEPDKCYTRPRLLSGSVPVKEKIVWKHTQHILRRTSLDLLFTHGLVTAIIDQQWADSH